MRLAYLVTGYPAPSHTFVLNEVRALRALGVEVATFAPVRSGPEQVLSAADEEARSSTFSWRPIRPLTHLRAHARALGTCRSAYFRALRCSLSRRHPGVRSAVWHFMYFAQGVVLWHRCLLLGISHVHVHFPNSSSDIAMAATDLGGGGWGWSLHIHGPTEFYDVRGTNLALKVEHADFVICISDFSRSQLMAITPTSGWDKLDIVHCGTEKVPQGARRVTARNVLHIVCVGRLVPEKGQHVLLDALQQLPPDLLGRIRCTFVGDGPERPTLEAKVDATALASRVHFTGALSHPEVLEVVSDADLFCLPSFAEGVPVSLMEAMARGVPVVSTRIMGIPELVDGTSGILVAPGSVPALTEALVELLPDPQRRLALGEGGREAIAAGFDLDKTAQELHALFKRRLEGIG